MNKYPQIPKSITNPNVFYKDALDNYSPLDYINFLKLTKNSGGSDANKYYEYYILKWNENKRNISKNTKSNVVERYKEFIKDISLNYTTEEEKKFLSKIDFDNPLDLEIAIPFYTKKIYDIAEYYRLKREDTKFELTNKKIKGTPLGINQRIKKSIISLIENLENSKIDIDIESIKNNLEVEIEELYDSHDDYYNQTPDPFIFDKTDIDYGLDIFLRNDSELISEIFNGISDKLIELKECDELFDNKRKLTRKNIYTDYYYISTGNTTNDILSGHLFSVNNSTFNFFNKNYPTHIFTEQNDLKTPREYGFFRPYKKAGIVIDGKNYDFTIKWDKLESNKIYYYPNPDLLEDPNKIMVNIPDYNFLKRNYSSGSARNEPYSKEHDTKYYGYASKIEPSTEKYFETITNTGYFKDFKSDINGNLFGLLVSEPPSYNFTSSIEESIYYQVFNGYVFYDKIYSEGFLFNYNTEDYTTNTETIRSGLSGGNFGYFIPYSEEYIIDFGNFDNIRFIEPTDDNLADNFFIVDGITFTDTNGDYYPDEISSDLFDFENTDGDFYFTNLIEGGIASDNPISRALVDGGYPTISASFIAFQETSAVRVLDGGFFSQTYTFENSENESSEIIIPSGNSTLLYDENLINTYEQTIYIKNSYNKTILPIVEAMKYINTKYDSTIIAELSSDVKYFELTNDVLFIETPTKLLVEKIVFVDGEFINSTNTITSITHNTDFLEKISNRYKVDDYVYFCKIKNEGAILTETTFYLEIYRTNLKNNKTDLIHPTDTPNYFTIDNGVDVFTDCSRPFLTHSKRNNIFSVVSVFKTPTHYPTINIIDFYMNPDPIFTNHNIIYPSENSKTNILSENSYTPILSSTTPITSLDELIL